MKESNFEQTIQFARQELELLQLCSENLEFSPELLSELLSELDTTLESLQHQLENWQIGTEITLWNSDRHLKIVENSAEAYIVTDRWGTIQEVNPAATELLKVPQILLVGKLLSIFVADTQRADFRQALIELLIHGKPIAKKELLLQPWECKPIPIKMSASHIYNSVGQLVGLCWLIQNVSCDRQELERLNHSLFYDSLTGLLNYTGFLKRFEHTLKMYRRHPERAFALLFIDLDGFKQINDRLGHLGGNQILKEAAHRLLRCLREIDTVSRFGGDEFVILLEDISSLADAQNCADKIQRSLQQPLEFDGQEIALKASVGIVESSPAYKNYATYLHHADLAMYDAKRSGGCCYRVAQF